MSFYCETLNYDTRLSYSPQLSIYLLPVLCQLLLIPVLKFDEIKLQR